MTYDDDLVESMLEKYKNIDPYFIDWKQVCKNRVLSEEYILKHEDLFDWNYISKYQNLSEEFIVKNHHKLNFKLISRYQNLSNKFIEKYKKILDTESLILNEKLECYNEERELLKTMKRISKEK